MFNFNKKKNNEELEQETLTFEEVKSENQTLYTQLTKKNQNYMFQLNSRLESLDYSPVKKEYVYNEMLKEIIAAQDDAITARKMYGTVTEQADNILGKKVYAPGAEDEGETSPTWQIYVDGALMAGGMFNLISGFSAMQAAATAETQVRLWQLIFNFLLGGLAVMVLTKYAPKKGETKGLLRYALATIIVVVSWALVTGILLAAIPDVLNPIIQGVVVMIIGALGLVGKWLFKRHYNVQGTLF